MADIEILIGQCRSHAKWSKHGPSSEFLTTIANELDRLQNSAYSARIVNDLHAQLAENKRLHDRLYTHLATLTEALRTIVDRCGHTAECGSVECAEDCPEGIARAALSPAPKEAPDA